jgi:hypothetical protein
VPTASADVENVAVAVPFGAPLPKVVVPSRNVTVPVGAPATPEVTVAVNVNDCPTTDGFADETSELVAPYSPYLDFSFATAPSPGRQGRVRRFLQILLIFLSDFIVLTSSDQRLRNDQV